MTNQTFTHARQLPEQLDASAGEAALQLVEVILLGLIDRKVILRDDLVVQIEALAAATPQSAPPRLQTLKARLGEVASSLRACDLPRPN